MIASSVLIVDDDQDIRELVMEMLSQQEFPCVGASSGEEAIEIVTARPEAIDVIVLDVNMPGMDGTEVLHFLQRSPETAHIPIIMVTAGATRDQDIVRGVEGGATDYLTKPCSPDVLLAKVRATRARALAHRKLRDELACASRTAMTDPLTGLCNRRNFDARIAEASAHAKRHGESFAMVMLDLDHFKRINDTHGHEEGDRVLAQFSLDIRAVLRAEDLAFRYGGEEFALLLRVCDASRAEDVANRLRSRLRARPFRFRDGTEQTITFSAGTAAAQASEGFSGHQLVARADRALYSSKSHGRDRVESWQPAAT